MRKKNIAFWLVVFALLPGFMCYSVISDKVWAQTVKRHADGTVEVIDEETIYTPHTSPGFQKHGSSRAGKRIGAYKVNHGDVSVKRNADGTVEVMDTSSTTRRRPVQNKASKTQKPASKTSASKKAAK